MGAHRGKYPLNCSLVAMVTLCLECLHHKIRHIKLESIQNARIKYEGDPEESEDSKDDFDCDKENDDDLKDDGEDELGPEDGDDEDFDDYDYGFADF